LPHPSHDSQLMSRLAIAITIPVTHTAKAENSTKSVKSVGTPTPPPFPPLCKAILTLRGIALRLMPDSRSITNYFALALVLWGAGFLQWGHSRRL
jgi:hypothetical protein